MRSLWNGPESEGGLVSSIWGRGNLCRGIVWARSAEFICGRGDRQTVGPAVSLDGSFPVDRQLYLHQERAIRAEAEKPIHDGQRPAIVLTAGTGAGKTEAFLLPLLNGLFRAARPAGAGGVRAIILYPMNALVNDQVSRLDKWLKGQSAVSLFHFTGETPEDPATANRQGYRSSTPEEGVRGRKRAQTFRIFSLPTTRCWSICCVDRRTMCSLVRRCNL